MFASVGKLKVVFVKNVLWNLGVKFVLGKIWAKYETLKGNIMFSLQQCIVDELL